MAGKEVWTLKTICGSCNSKISVHAHRSPQITASQSVDRKFELACSHPGCTWTGTKCGLEAVDISDPHVIRIDAGTKLT
jgi:hypothetical protein